MLDRVLAELAKTERLLHALLAEASGGEAPGASHIVVLEALSAHTRMTGAELGRAASITPQAMNEVVRRLEQSGEVTRSPHPIDKRKIEYEITGAGTRRIARWRTARSRAEKRLESRWDISRQEALLAELTAANRDFEAELAPPSEGEATSVDA